MVATIKKDYEPTDKEIKSINESIEVLEKNN